MFSDIETGVIITVVSAGIVALFGYTFQWLRKQRKLLVWVAKQMANDGNGSWRSSVNDRLTAIEAALPGVTTKPEPISSPPITQKEKDK